MAELVRGTEIQVNGAPPADSVPGDQNFPVGVTFANGQTLFLYETQYLNLDEDVNGNLFDANLLRSAAVIGSPVFGFSNSALNDTRPAIAVLANQTTDRALAVWQSGTGGIQERLVDSNGNVLTNGVLTIAPGATEITPDVAAFSGSSGRSVVTWLSTFGGAHVVAETLQADGTTLLAGSNQNVSSFGLQAANPHVTTLDDGSYVVVWQDNDHTVSSTDPSGLGIHAAKFSATGRNGITVNINTNGDQFNPEIATLSSGDFVVTWQDNSHLPTSGGTDDSGSAIKARVFHADLSQASDEFTVNKTFIGDQSSPSVAAMPGGNFVVAWTDSSGSLDSSGTGIVARAFSGSGTPITGEYRVNNLVDNNQDQVSLSSRPDGSILATFRDGSQLVDSVGQSRDLSGLGIQAEVLTLKLDPTTNPGPITGPDPITGADPTPTPPHITRIERFWDSATNDHFYTSDVAEINRIRATLPTYHDEGSLWGTPDKGADTVDVFRFYNTATKDHFYTNSATERDFVIAHYSDFHFEGVAFQAYTAPSAATLTLDRFYNPMYGVHHYSASASETALINSGGVGPGWVEEGPGLGFIVHS